MHHNGLSQLTTHALKPTTSAGGPRSELRSRTSDNGAFQNDSRSSRPRLVIYWCDDLSQGPVPITETLQEFTTIRKRFWNALAPLNRLCAAEQVKRLKALTSEKAKAKAARLVSAAANRMSDRDEGIRGLSDASDIVVWFASNRREILMLLALLNFLDPTLLQTGRVWVAHCGKCGPQAFDADRLAELFGSGRPIGQQFTQLAHDGWKSYTRPDPVGLEELALRLRDQPDTLIGDVFSRILEEYPSTHNGLSRMEGTILRRLALQIPSWALSRVS